MARITEKGYVLALVMIFIVILTASSLGLYATVQHLITETYLQDQRYTEGYYLALAGVRYAKILIGMGIAQLPNVRGTSYTVTGQEIVGASNFFTDIGLDNIGRDLHNPNARLEIIITFPTDGEIFEITSTYLY